MQSQESFSVNRKAFSIGSLTDAEEKAYWLRQTPAKRLRALEQNRQIIFGYDPTTTRLSRILEIVERPSG